MVLIDAVKAERKWIRALMDCEYGEYAGRQLCKVKEEPRERYAAAKWFVAEFQAMGARKQMWDEEETARRLIDDEADSEFPTI